MSLAYCASPEFGNGGERGVQGWNGIRRAILALVAATASAPAAAGMRDLNGRWRPNNIADVAAYMLLSCNGAYHAEPSLPVAFGIDLDKVKLTRRGLRP